jgi:hypothetical protein
MWAGRPYTGSSQFGGCIDTMDLKSSFGEEAGIGDSGTTTEVDNLGPRRKMIDELLEEEFLSGSEALPGSSPFFGDQVVVVHFAIHRPKVSFRGSDGEWNSWIHVADSGRKDCVAQKYPQKRGVAAIDGEGEFKERASAHTQQLFLTLKRIKRS